MSFETLLKALSDGEFHSGEELGALTGISRTAIWKQVKKFQEFGLDVESIRGKGYRLKQPLSLLSSDAIQPFIDAAVSSQLNKLEILQSIASTNSHALQQAAAGTAKGYVCVAERQTAGRGRRGRAWISPFASNIYLSLVWGFDGGAAALEGLSLAVGVALVNTLEKLGVTGLALKWPNDLLHEGKKLAGVLLEMTGDASGYCQVVIGIGLNVQMAAHHASEIDQAWSSVGNILGSHVNRNQLIGMLLSELVPALQAFEKHGFVAFKARWCELDAYKDQAVRLELGEQKIFGMAKGVTSTGALQIETGQGLQTFNGGEISLRLQQ